MRKIKKSLALLLSVCMLLSGVNLTAFAAEVNDSDNTVSVSETADETESVESAVENTSDESITEATETVPVQDEISETEENTELITETEAIVEETTENDNHQVVLEDRWLNPSNAGVSLTSDSSSDFLKITFLDCGRKYFSVASIEKIIDNAAAAGFNYIQLAVGNDGLRFLLDDMSLTVNGTTYASELVSSAIHAGNEAYYNFDTDELTQSEMDTIIAYAKSKGLGVIPCINSPGHMDAVLSAANKLTGITCSYNGSARTIDVTNSTAVAFTQALIQKYMTYFAGKGCQYFNMGADEYANDIYTSGSMGFGNLQSTGKYSYYVKYVNQMATAIKNAGMKPMAFNDGIYFNSNTSSGTFDTDIIVCYWSNGWSGYTPMPAATLASMGFQLVNTDGSYYWVLGKSDWQCDATTASGFDYKEFQGGTIDNPAGAMFCIWCDYPGAGTEASVITSTQATIAAFGKTLPASDNSNETPVEPSNPTEKTITVSVGDTVTDTIVGSDYSGTYKTDDENIATVKAVKKEVQGDTKLVLGSKVTESTSSVSNGQYIISDGNGNYIKRNGTSIENTTDINEATVWTVSRSSSNLTLKDGSYYLSRSNRNSLIASTSSSNWKNDSDGLYYSSSSWGWSDYYLYYSSGWSVSAWNNGGALYNYTTETTTASTNTELTFTGVAVGTTYVTIGGVKYTINVVDAAPSDALTDTSLKLEYWITNYVVYDANSESTGNTSQTITTSTTGAVTENGIEISTIAPNPAYSFFDGSVTVYYWQAMRLDADHQQTKDSGGDQTASGTTLTHVRYYNNAWQYQTTDTKWHYFKSTDQLVAYYLQKTEVTKEMATYVKDWGYGTSSTTPDTSSNKGQVALTVAVVYPDGTVSPAEGNMYANSTTIFNYWDNRDIGIIAPTNNSDYNIAKITVTDGARDSNTSKNVWYSGDTITWDKVTTDAGTKWYNETTVWDKTANAGTTPMVNGKNSNITWSGKNKAKLVLIYLETVEKSTNLNVVYYDDAYNKEITHSQIAMTYKQGDEEPTFITKLENGGNPVQKGDIILSDDAYVTNSSSINQTFNKDITTVPNVAAQYKSGLYKYVKAEISEDGKTLILHYNIDDTKLDKTYVVDFGLSLNIPLSDLVKDINVNNVTFGEINNGTAVYKNGTITYTPDKVLDEMVTLPVRISYTGEKYQTIRVAICPATTVYYEEGFADYTGSWTGASKGSGSQNTAVLGQDSNNYGYDAAYTNTDKVSNGTEAVSTTLNDTAVFSFKGTGLDILSHITGNTGFLTVKIVDNNTNKTVKMALINTKMAGNQTAGSIEGYNTPVYSITDLPWGSYTVTIVHSMNNNTVSLDGFRVYNTIQNSSIYKADKEDNPSFLEVRDLQFGTIDVSGYGTNGRDVYAVGEQVYKDLTSDGVVKEAAITVSGQDAMTNQKDLLENGPKNEVYLAKGSSITLSFKTAREVQLGLKGINGPTTYSIKEGTEQHVSTVDMFYTIQEQGGSTEAPTTITIKNTGEHVLSITKLKVCDDPDALQPITADSVTDALYALGFKDPVPMANASLTITVKTLFGRTIGSTTLTYNGEEGTSHTFTKDEIKAAATEVAASKGYKMYFGNQYKDVTINCGESAGVKYLVTVIGSLFNR